MEPALEAVAFLAGAPSRTAVLKAVKAGPATPAELRSRTDVSRTTLWRTLNGLEERGWVVREDGTYECTAAGRLVATALAECVGTVRAVGHLADVLQWLPTDEMPFDLVRLGEATVAVPTPEDPQAPMRLATRQVREADRVRILTHAMVPWVLEVLSERAVAGDVDLTFVVTRGVLEASLADARSAGQLDRLLAADGVESFRYDGEIPHLLALLDGDRVGIGVDDDAGRPRAVMDVSDPEVARWAEETFDSFRDRATAIDGPDSVR